MATLSLRQVKSRIRGIENVKKVTHAMDMVSVAKLKTVQNKMAPLAQYFLKIEELLKKTVGKTPPQGIRFLRQPDQARKAVVFVITSDTGLCSVYNQHIIKKCEDFIAHYGAQKLSLITIGRKGYNHFRKNPPAITHSFIELNGRFSDEVSEKIVASWKEAFLSEGVDEVYAAYTHFITASKHVPVVEKILPLSLSASEDQEYIFEPGRNEVLAELIPVYLSYKMKLVLLDAFCSEHSSRMVAMAEATNNAKELLEGLIMQRNKLRQATITKEIMEIISAAELLR